MFILPGALAHMIKPVIVVPGAPKKYIADGKVYEETETLKFIANGKIKEEDST